MKASFAVVADNIEELRAFVSELKGIAPSVARTTRIEILLPQDLAANHDLRDKVLPNLKAFADVAWRDRLVLDARKLLTASGPTT